MTQCKIGEKSNYTAWPIWNNMYSPIPPKYTWEYYDFYGFNRWRYQISHKMYSIDFNRLVGNLRIAVLLLLIINMIVLLTISQIPFITTGERGSVSGTVMDNDRHPVPGARVVYNGHETITDMNGKFKLDNVEYGAVYIQVYPPNSSYDETLYSSFITQENSDNITIEMPPRGMGDQILNDELALVLAFAIIGAVLVIINILTFFALGHKRGYGYLVITSLIPLGMLFFYIVSISLDTDYLFERTWPVGLLSFFSVLIGIYILSQTRKYKILHIVHTHEVVK